MIVILYTTLYRKGGKKFERVAKTLQQELGGDSVLCQAVESKSDVRRIFFELTESGNEISQLHFIGHSGMYGPMFGTVDFPEQFSPYEWGQLKIPFAKGAEAYFHCCRSARWFAPYFARVFSVKSYGYHWYTTFSSLKDKFKLDRSSDSQKPLYCFGHIGRKSHGYIGSFKKYFGLTSPEKMKVFEPEELKTDDDTYNKVADLYDAVFQDIKVREDEWNWLSGKVGRGKVLDIGCGNGALLKELASQIDEGIGVDESEYILNKARRLNESNSNISFQKIDGPTLPFSENEFDTVISMLSFRYLDWDPMMNEICRVLKNHGKLLILDMVTAPVKASEFFNLLKSKLRHYKHRKKFPEYYKSLNQLVSHPDWKKMLKYNPIRSQHEMKWYLESRFPGSKIEIINVGWNARILAFEVIGIEGYQEVKLTYP